MSEITLFRLIDSQRVEWLAGNASVQRGMPGEFLNQAPGQRLILVVPGEAVTLTQVSVPGRNRSTWLKAIPYALEDNLAGDVEDLHFALGEARSGAEVPVAVVSHALMRAWMDTCAQAGITPAAVIPDILLLPYEQGSWSLLLENNRGVLRCGPWAGFAAEREDVALLLQLALTEASENPPQSLRVWGNGPPEFSALPIAIQQEPASEPLQVFAAGFNPTTAIDLLQGPYSRKAHLGKWLRPWRTAAALAGLWLGLQVSAQIYEYWHLSRQQASLRDEMEQVFKAAVPDVRKVVNPRAQLENRLRELRQGNLSSESAFLELLLRGGQPLVTAQGVTLRSLRYKDDQLDLDLEGSSLESLDQLKQRLSEQPELSSEMRTTKQEGKVQSQVTLKGLSS